MTENININKTTKENKVGIGHGQLKTKEAALEWNVSKVTIYRWVREGKLRPYTGLKEWRFHPDDINGILERL